MTSGGKGGMWTGLALGFALTCAGNAACAADAPAAPPAAGAAPVADYAVPAPQTNTAITIMKVDAALQGGDCAKALPLLAQLWDDANLQAQDAELAEKYRFSRVICTAQEQDIKAALALSEQNMRHVGAGVQTYDLHAFLLLSDERPEEAAATLDEAVTRFPKDIAKLTDESVIGTLMALNAKSPDVTPPLLDHLEKARWQVDNIVLRFAVDYLRLNGLRAAVKRNDRALAELYRTDIANNAMMYIVSQGDGTISDPAVAPWPIKPIIKKQINEVGTYVAAHPDQLFAVQYLITLEHMNEDDGAALLQIGTIIDLINTNGLDKFDSPDSLPDIFIKKATMLAEAGRVESALDTYKFAAARMTGPELFDFNIAYMNFLIDIGRDKEALALEGRIDLLALDDGQRNQLASTEACAYAYMGDTARYDALMRLTRDDSGLGQMQSYLCAGDVENAARAMIRDINDLESRDSMITQVQTTLPDIPYSPRSKAYYAAYAALKKRPDVQAAIKAQNMIVRGWPLRF